MVFSFFEVRLSMGERPSLILPPQDVSKNLHCIAYPNISIVALISSLSFACKRELLHYLKNDTVAICNVYSIILTFQLHIAKESD